MRAPVPPGRMEAPDEATARQWQAADPGASTWVGANAGSGKTRVLTDRVARLLLGGVKPDRILCLTYTKAAAAEMQNRLFDRLGGWAMMPDERLLAELGKLGAEVPDAAAALADARTLFARAVDTPGGLRIQTIHAFCAALLRRFPLEAHVPPGFREAPDRGAARLREDVLTEIAEGPERHLLDALARHHSDDDLAGFAARAARLPAVAERAALAELLGVPASLTRDDVARIAFEPGDADLLRETVRHLASGKASDVKNAGKIDALRPELADLSSWESAFLMTGPKAGLPKTPENSGQPIGTKDVRGRDDFPAEALDALMHRIEAAAQARRALAALERTDALRGFVGAFHARYSAAKLRRGWLDFDDLLSKARDLLADPAVAPWVLWKLDGGIDHVLVDEAQDTSPVQWELIEALVREMTAGEGAERPDRSLFVVGDPKQSIYGFQGADPEGFARTRDDLGRRMTAAGETVHDVPLLHSFRSAGAVLGAVDAMLDRVPEMHENEHLPFWEALPGRVDLWPPAENPEKPEPGDWHDPVDRPAEDAAALQVARAVVDRVGEMIAGGEPIPHRVGDRVVMRPAQGGDFLILVRSRGPIFEEIIRHAKSLGLPVAGADRLRVAAELAVRDVTSLLAFLSLPEDDLSLAEALRSPLLGWSEADLYAAAHGRPEGRSLWEELRDRSAEWPETDAMLRDLRDATGFRRPFELIERILTHHDGRRRLAARLGPEVEEGIDALLGLAIEYERDEVPTLTGFVSWLRTDGSEIKRVAEGAGGLIRVMTVHGAKGLEAPVVILPQTGPLRGRPAQVPDLLPTGVGTVWKPASGDMPVALLAAAEAEKLRMAAEDVRLLYVAMTRAESWLVVAGAGEMGKGDSWHGRVEEALRSLGAQPIGTPFGDGLRYERGDWSGPAEAPPAAPDAATPLPGWATRPPPAATEPPPVGKPSELGGAKSLPGDEIADGEAARLRGIHLHRLLEHLPLHPDEPDLGVASDLLTGGAEGAEPDALPGLVEAARAVLDAPALKPLFAPGTLAEVDIAGDVPGIGPMAGTIDRLIVGERVLAVDYKSNAAVPACAEDVPEGLLRQLGAYAALLGPAFPGRGIDLAILWTAGPVLMPVPGELAAAALARAAP